MGDGIDVIDDTIATYVHSIQNVSKRPEEVLLVAAASNVGGVSYIQILSGDCNGTTMLLVRSILALYVKITCTIITISITT